MHTLECVNGYLGTVALFLANFSWHVAWTKRSSQLQGVPWLYGTVDSWRRDIIFVLDSSEETATISNLILDSDILVISLLSLTKGKKYTSSGCIPANPFQVLHQWDLLQFFHNDMKREEFLTYTYWESVFSYHKGKSCSLRNRFKKIWEKSFTTGHWSNFSFENKTNKNQTVLFL